MVTYMREIHGLSFVEAVEELAHRAKLKWPSELKPLLKSDQTGQEHERRQVAYKLNRFIAKFYRDHLTEVLPYIRTRGVTDEIDRSFYLGYSPSFGLYDYLEAAKAPMDIAEDLGVFRKERKSELLRDRVIFPIADLRGKIVGFGGRILKNAESGEDPGPKFLNSKDSPIFQKQKVLYGIFQAQRYIREMNEVLVVEGYFDVLVLHAAGIKNVVATCGTALTGEHLQVLRRLCDRLVLLFDPDRAGIQATDRAMELGLKSGWMLHFVALPDQKDPDEFLWNGRNWIEGATDHLKAIVGGSKLIFMDRLERLWKREALPPDKEAEAYRKTAQWLLMIPDSLNRGVWIKTLIEQFNLRDELLQAALKVVGQESGGRGSYRPTLPQNRPTAMPVALETPKPAVAPQAKPAQVKKIELSKREQIILRGLYLGGVEFWAFFESTLQEIETWILESLQTKGLGEKLHWDMSILQGGEVLMESTLTQNLYTSIKEKNLNSELIAHLEAHKGAPEPDLFRLACLQCLQRFWARISHRIQDVLKGSAGVLEDQETVLFSQEYLDVLRRMNELNHLKQNLE